MEAFAALFGPLYCPEEHLDLYHEEPGEDAKEQCPAVLDDELLPLLEVHRAKEGPVLAAEGISLGRVWENRGRSTGSKAAVAFSHRLPTTRSEPSAFARDTGRGCRLARRRHGIVAGKTGVNEPR